MNKILIGAIALTVAAGLSAQTTSNATLKAATNYGSLSKGASKSDFNAVAKDKTSSRGLGARSFVGTRRSMEARALSAASIARGRSGAYGLRVSESGSARAGASAGTSASAPNASSPSLGKHTVSLTLAAGSGKDVKLALSWFGRATTGASSTVSVDINGDNMPDFTGKADGMRKTANLMVKAGANGVTISITTEGKAAGANMRGASYSSGLFIQSDFGGNTGGNCTITAFGPECGGKMTGTASTRSGVSISLRIAGAAKNSIGVLVIGKKLTSPVTLPGSTCTLAVDPKATRAFRTDSMGNARSGLFSRSGNFEVDAQSITLEISSGGAKLASTNSLNIKCQ